MRFDPRSQLARNLQAEVPGRAEAFLARIADHPRAIAASATVSGCLAGGYAPRGYGLADFTIIRRDGVFHLFHIPRVPGNSCIDHANEHWFGHATSGDLDTWVTRDPVLATEPANPWEAGHLWAPFVLDTPQGALMAYTGLSSEPSQVLCLAESHDPALAVWRRLPGNPLFPWGGLPWHRRNAAGHARMGRDPHIVRVDDHWLMAYTGMHADGCPVVGGLISRDLRAWDDIGPILWRPMRPDSWMPESVNIQPLDHERWALIASVSPGLTWHESGDPHAWHGSEPRPVAYDDGPAEDLIAPEVLVRHGREWLIAYFTPANRLLFGILDTSADPWRVRRVTAPGQLASWL